MTNVQIQSNQPVTIVVNPGHTAPLTPGVNTMTASAAYYGPYGYGDQTR